MDSISSNIHLWTKPRSQKGKKSKDELLLEISSITHQVINLRPLNVQDLEAVLAALKQSKKIKVQTPPKTKVEYAEQLKPIIKSGSATRLALSDLKALMGVFSE